MKPISFGELYHEDPRIVFLHVINNWQVLDCCRDVTQKFFLVESTNLHAVGDFFPPNVSNRAAASITFVSIKRLLGIDFYHPLALTLSI